MKSVNIYIPLLLLLFSVGACGTKKSGGTSGALTDEALLDTVQRRTFNYFWDGAEPNSGLARERIHMEDRKSTRLNSSHYQQSRMPSSA